MYVCLSVCMSFVCLFMSVCLLVSRLFVCVYLFVCSRRHSQRRTILVIQPWPTRRQKPESTQWSHLICHCSLPLNAMLPESFLFLFTMVTIVSTMVTMVSTMVIFHMPCHVAMLPESFPFSSFVQHWCPNV